MSSFERLLSVRGADLVLELRGHRPAPWADLLLNPRRLRGSDFLMRWSQGVWSERRLVQAVARSGRYVAVPYGPSGTAPENDVRAFELYFERLDAAGLGDLKRPDLLVFRSSDAEQVTQIVADIGGESELPFTGESDPRMQRLLRAAVLAVECENSLWIAGMMPDYGIALTSQKRLGGRPGLKKKAVTPTIVIKEEDRDALRRWQADRGVPLHIWHVFYDMAFGISLDEAEQLIASGLIEPTDQVYQAPSGATTRKTIYKIYYHYGYPLGEMGGAGEPDTGSNRR